MGRPADRELAVPGPSRPAIRAGLVDITRATPAQSSRPGVDHHLRDHRERGLEAEHPEGRVDEGVLLVVARVRGVVGGDGVDRAVGQRGAQRLDVLLGRSGGLTLKVGS